MILNYSITFGAGNADSFTRYTVTSGTNQLYDNIYQDSNCTQILKDVTNGTYYSSETYKFSTRSTYTLGCINIYGEFPSQPITMQENYNASLVITIKY